MYYSHKAGKSPALSLKIQLRLLLSLLPWDINQRFLHLEPESSLRAVLPFCAFPELDSSGGAGKPQSIRYLRSDARTQLGHPPQTLLNLHLSPRKGGWL